MKAKIKHEPDMKALKKKLTENLLKLANENVLVGVPAGKTEDDGTSLALIAAVHEYGSPEHNVPERSFIRSAILSSKLLFRKLNLHNCKKVFRNEMSVDKALAQVGLLGQAQVQIKMHEGPFTPLKPATVRAKNSSQPLIDTGHLIQSITFAVEAKKK